MFGVDIILLISAFIAGVLMFLAPCTLPLVPGYIAFISGVAHDEVWKRTGQKAIVKNSIGFVLGFSLVFISLGILAGFFGTFVGQYKALITQIGGVFIIVFGLMMLRVVRIIPLLKTYSIQLPKSLRPGYFQSSTLMGAIFALGWTPCIGPVLASILFLASSVDSVVVGGILLTVFSAGFALPFILVALMFSKATHFIGKHASISSMVANIGGVFLIMLGVLLATNNFVLLVSYGTVLFNLFGFEKLLLFY